MTPPPSIPLTTSTPAAATRGGTRIVDRYEIQAVIGRGAGGAVYRAVDIRLGRTVALKTASGSGDGARLTDRVRQRFLREAMALSKVDQRNVVQVLDYGFADDGAPFLVMEHLRGRDLGAVLARTKGPLPVPQVADIGLGVCAALRACHRLGIIHRDLKPANVFLVDTDTGVEIKVLDFGVSNAAAADDRTRQAQVMPASHHLAPEQIDGKAGPASDQYALGVLLHFCLTRRFPDPLNGGRRGPRSLQLPSPLDAVLGRATRLAPAERFPSVYALGRELLDFASPQGQAQWRDYYHPALGHRPSWTPSSPTLRDAERGTLPDGAGPVTSTKVSRRAARAVAPGADGRGRASKAWPLCAATVGCVALAASGLANSRRRPAKPVPHISARREIAPPAPHRPAERGALPRLRERAPSARPATLAAAMMAPVSPPERAEPPPPQGRRRMNAPPTPPAAVLPDIEAAAIVISAPATSVPERGDPPRPPSTRERTASVPERGDALRAASTPERGASVPEREDALRAASTRERTASVSERGDALRAASTLERAESAPGPRRRVNAPAPAAAALPNIDGAGIGIPAE